MSDDSLLIYCPKKTSRLQYTFDLIFKDVLGVNYCIINNIDEFKLYEGPKICYSNQFINGELFFGAAYLLFETGIKEQSIQVFDWNGIKAFFKTQTNSIFPFDPFAASFYLVSRYEEYLPYKPDRYERFPLSESLAFLNDFYKKPLINIWALKIKELIIQKYPQLHFQERKYKYLSTFDIDCAYYYKEKGMMRTIGGYGKSIINKDFKEVLERTSVLLNFHKDPFDSYDKQLELHKKYNLKPVYFFLVGEYDVNDKNISIDKERFQALIKSVADYAFVGIHPSYGSNKKQERLPIEIKQLTKVIKRDITKSRQHFLKLSLPVTYQRLIELDIQEDYTMGYPTEPGFRASICTPFYFYDLDRERITKLKILPFEIMDATFKYYLTVKPEDFISNVKPLIDEVRAVNGTFISIWHNDSLGTSKLWEGWENIYEEFLKIAYV